MKKVIFNTLSAAALVMLAASCSNDETLHVNTGDAIGFRASLGKASRANSITLSNLHTFYVTALGNGENYFTRMEVNSHDNGQTWHTAQTHYWPDYKLEFFACNMRTNMSVTPDEQVIADFQPHILSAPVGEQGYEAQHDLVVAYNTGTRAQNEATGVSLNFKHILSQIEIHAKNSDPTKKVEVLGVRLCRMGTTGTFTLDPAVETTQESVISRDCWHISGLLKQNYLLRSSVGAEPLVLSATPANIMQGDDNFMVIPQQTTAWTGGNTPDGTYISVLCRIYSVNENGTETLLYPAPTDTDPKDGMYAFSSVAVPMDLHPGYKYTYTLEFFGAGGGAGLVDPDPATQPEYEDIDLNPNPDKDGGEDVFGLPIKFIVTVDEWKDAGSQNVDM